MSGDIRVEIIFFISIDFQKSLDFQIKFLLVCTNNKISNYSNNNFDLQNEGLILSKKCEHQYVIYCLIRLFIDVLVDLQWCYTKLPVDYN